MGAQSQAIAESGTRQYRERGRHHGPSQSRRLSASTPADENFTQAIKKTLLYFDIWQHPLTAEELYAFLPVASRSPGEFRARLRKAVSDGEISVEGIHYFVSGSASNVRRRLQRERHARRMWLMARFFMHIIKRFPFVRGIMVSGDLSKNSTGRSSDIDFLILAEPGRLWIARTLLTIFKKTFLFNRKKFFCLNSFAATDHLLLDERDIYLATEVATLKPLYNSNLFFSYLNANGWIKSYFPNFDVRQFLSGHANDRRSTLQRVLEFPFSLIPAEALDRLLQSKMERIWEKRYPEVDAVTRARIFRCSRSESRAYVGDFQAKILARYEQQLRDFGVRAYFASADD